MIARLAALHVIAAGLLAGAWLAGWLQILLHADRWHALPVLGFVLLVGLWLAGRRRWADVEWVADLLPILGLIGTVVGFILTAATGDLATAAGKTALAVDVLYALVSNLGGIVGYAWLTLVRRIGE